MIAPPEHRLEAARRVADRLASAGSLAISTHVGGDGDGWGSACALAHHYRPLGKNVVLLAASPYPRRFRFLLPPDVEPLEVGEPGNAALREADAQVVVDASEASRLGDFAPLFEPARTLVIDHHPITSDILPAAASFIDPDACATAELVYDLLVVTGSTIEPETARALYVGLVTDTGSFRYSNSTARSHRVAADLIDAGADPEALYEPLFGSMTREELAVLRTALTELNHDHEAGITWTALDADVIERFGELDEYERIMEHLRNLSGTRIAVLFRELGREWTKVSLRSNGRADVRAIAGRFGGGGHHKAAGAVIPGEPDEVRERVLDACRTAIRELADGSA